LGRKSTIFDAADYLTDAWISREAHELGLRLGLNSFLNGNIHSQTPGHQVTTISLTWKQTGS